jgi:hypothetical protein
MLAVAGPATAADPGLTVLPFLEIGVGARSAALGGAYVSLASDATATYWNPAGLLGIKRNDILGVHNAWIQDLRQEFIGVGMHRGRHAFGLSFVGMYTGDIEGRDDTGALDGSFGFSDNAFSLSYAFQAAKTLGLGGTVRYVRESVIGAAEGDFSLSGFSFDLGADWQTPLRGVKMAAAFRNLGGQLSYNFDGAKSFDLPSSLQAGVSYQMQNQTGGFTVSGDLLATKGQDVSPRAGVEYAYRGQFRLGAGYRGGLDNENISFGLGYTNKVNVYYAYLPISSDLGSSHRISLGYSW